MREEVNGELQTPIVKFNVAQVVKLGRDHPLLAERPVELDALFVEPARFGKIAGHARSDRLHVQGHSLQAFITSRASTGSGLVCELAHLSEVTIS